MKRILVFAMPLLFLLVGCVTPPQTFEELRVGVRGKAFMTQMKEYEVDRPFNKVFNSLKKNTDRCLNVTTTSSTPSKYGPISSSIRYRSSTKKTGKGAASSILQQDARATGKMPAGGYFVLLTDIEKVSKNKTRLTLYGPSVGYDKIFDSIHDWAQGKERKCSKFPGRGLGVKFRYHNK